MRRYVELELMGDGELYRLYTVLPHLTNVMGWDGMGWN
jgi:hypothetical protein